MCIAITVKLTQRQYKQVHIFTQLIWPYIVYYSTDSVMYDICVLNVIKIGF